MNITIDTKTYITNVKELIETDHEVVLTVAGWSMKPFLRNGQDRVLLKRHSGLLKQGDIVFYQRDSGQYVLHRIYKIKPDGLYIAGDHLVLLEGPVKESSVFAKVMEVERGNHWISTSALSWKIISKVWMLLFPIRKLSYKIKKVIRK